jgi:hypothetical protein
MSDTRAEQLTYLRALLASIHRLTGQPGADQPELGLVCTPVVVVVRMGVRRPGSWCHVGCQRVDLVCDRAGPRGEDQASIGRERSRSRAQRSDVAQGQRCGRRRIICPLRFTSLPGRAKTRVRTVRVTVS